ncbi:hypothetical protein SAMN00790413_06637 [Deinococcus hopiensis KR-140]|uniref:ArsR family transcriptional regulator n=1 Tax=Deinococcus hopiensis KR-140 TaxID=695939 RepID=A0A1W1UC76_9DEIO|nr:hypothetical protein SAMN00790413_06637 [Deinococcus hopiensis KR-140]
MTRFPASQVLLFLSLTEQRACDIEARLSRAGIPAAPERLQRVLDQLVKQDLVRIRKHGDECSYRLGEGSEVEAALEAAWARQPRAGQGAAVAGLPSFLEVRST